MTTHDRLSFVVAADDAAPLPVRAPYDGALLARVPQSSADDVDRAVDRAGELLGQGLPQHERAQVLEAAATLVGGQRERLARDLAAEAAKPLIQARAEVDRCVSTLTFSAAAARTLTGRTIPLEGSAAGAGKIGWTERLPIGVVAAISPFNFPLNLVAHKVGPAIAAGCPVVLKPASATPLSALNLVALLVEAGLPRDWVQVVVGSGADIGDPLVTHPGLAFISFTGSPAVGWSIRARAPRADVGLELGNNTPLIVDRDADVADVAHRIRLAGFAHAGQSCISTQRILVHESAADAFITELVSQATSLRLGPPLAETTEVSSLIDAAETARVLEWIDSAVRNGAGLVCGGQVTPDGILEPTILVDADPTDDVCAKEVFGPVVVVRRYRELDTAITEANTTTYGLQAGIFTRDLEVAITVARALDFGAVLINEVPTWRADQMPYGGLRDSGNTKEGPAWAVEHMTREKLFVVSLPRAPA